MPRAKQRTPELEAQLLRSAVRALEAGDVNLTARSVASAAGTSTAALYELFGDKIGLIRAVFFDGFRQLQAVIDETHPTGDPRADLVALLAATRRFAVDHPLLFELMFARPFAEFRPGPADQAAATGIYRAVMSRVDACRDAGLLEGDRVDIAQVLVAANRGLIAAELAGILGRSRASATRRWRLAVDALLDGLAPRA